MMQKGFTLAETLITMAIVGIIMALAIPMAIQSTNDAEPLYKTAFDMVDNTVNELVNDVSLYPTGEFADNMFCNSFFSKLNTINYNPNNCVNTFVSTVDINPPFSSDTPNATTNNSMIWYGLQSNFTTSACDSGTTGIIISGFNPNTCIKISVDVNGIKKGIHTNSNQENRDIFDVYITRSGKVVMGPSPIAH